MSGKLASRGVAMAGSLWMGVASLGGVDITLERSEVPPKSSQTSIVAFALARPEDFEELVALRIEAMRESLERIGRFNPERARERFRAGFFPECTRHIVVSGERVGFLVVRHQPEEMLIDHLYIKPSFQGNGVGAIVLAQVFAEAEQLSLPVRVGALRESASNRFYVRHGFQLVECGEFDNYYVRHRQNAL